MKLDRNTLIEIRDSAKFQREGCGEDWGRAYTMLVNAADHLDAMMARCEVTALPDTAPERSKVTIEKRELEFSAQCQLDSFIKYDEEMKEKALKEWKIRYGYEYPQYTKYESYNGA